ncbi:lysophospholipid acyltransferase family protein [Candidatus Neoehrlichia procyonis]|uniref:lysophospholipid acyltransferase family protein n=1 Tax=Candidatus Neoehrlichia procyonis TaxID=467750 RepID=UPI002A4E1383|nr:lysophospholipid acyltransferase family protein [Candidatus Neoehrlichia lotoris]
MPLSLRIKCATFGTHVLLYLCNITDGITYEIRGKENLPAQPYIVASEHQSPLETLILFTIFKDAVFILKKEVILLPFFNIFFISLKMIFIDRNKKLQALKKMLKLSTLRLKEGRTIIIFPQGSRTTINNKAQYKSGVAALYNSLSVPIVPIALNTGLFWPKNLISFKKKSGKAIIEILPPINPGLNKKEFLEQLKANLSEKSYALCN